ncbi:MAG: 4-(cytidine 5'-diphospho)-2-C-methyl-D-erythritol kinase [Candidatus Cloacimonetes bacterium HGW-Cloacimonetes-3]|jgi:4-diphosphocytidyl-2-C-methyl-D-erythritol kinase|nr:MAG: 4-(cytidine 5'-diphospho)-2-C-methyl-D-erythritol kinase [Candidatus Cloacimonetes bacterium HGW-Cloacimonetes-3]
MLTASYAKINLFLEVIGKLPNNYHQVNTVLCSIDLCDYIRYNVTNDACISITSNAPALANKQNLIFKVATCLQNKYQIEQGIIIHLDKHIPIAAGLGGGSSNAANCITALNKLWHLNLSPIEMHEIAAQFGSDINFFLEGGCALGENRGEQITPLADVDIKNILLVNPNIHIASSEAYKLVIMPNPEDRQVFNISAFSRSCLNRLEAGIRMVYPAIDELLCSLSDYGASVAMMSGSGSTCFGIFHNSDTMQTCAEYFANKGYWTKITKTLCRNSC